MANAQRMMKIHLRIHRTRIFCRVDICPGQWDRAKSVGGCSSGTELLSVFPIAGVGLFARTAIGALCARQGDGGLSHLPSKSLCCHFLVGCLFVCLSCLGAYAACSCVGLVGRHASVRDNCSPMIGIIVKVGHGVDSSQTYPSGFGLVLFCGPMVLIKACKQSRPRSNTSTWQRIRLSLQYH